MTPPLPRISAYDTAALLDLVSPLPGGHRSLGRLGKALFQDGQTWDQVKGTLGPGVAGALEDRVAWPAPTLGQRFDGADGTTKLVVGGSPGTTVETVVIRHSGGRTTLCLSCQVGCALGCAFCTTGRQGLVRDLGAHEILDQATLAVRLLASEGKRLRNVVYMGMGEPLLNLEAVSASLTVLMDQRRFEVAPRRICVSTCGVIEAIEPFYRRFPRVKLAVSLHAPRQDLRDHLMPGCQRWPLADLLKAMEGYSAFTGHRQFFEYVMVAGVNDTDRELGELVSLLGPRRPHVNLIPYNPAPGDRWTASTRATLDRFQKALAAAGIATTVRRSAGDQIAAACGRLAGTP